MQPCLTTSLNTDSLPDLLPVALAAAVCKISQASLYNYLRAGNFPKPIKVSSRRVLWRKQDILSYLAMAKK